MFYLVDVKNMVFGWNSVEIFFMDFYKGIGLKI